jgi:hypothetical protein
VADHLVRLWTPVVLDDVAHNVPAFRMKCNDGFLQFGDEIYEVESKLFLAQSLSFITQRDTGSN